MASTYDIGDIVRITSVFTQNAAVIDPSTVALAIKAPDATTTTYTYAGATITKDSPGTYHVDVAPTLTGTWRYRWVSTGTGAGAEESWFQVRVRRVT
jgi:hypothetical protein